MTPVWAADFVSHLDGFGTRLLQVAAICDNCGHASLAVANNFYVTGNDHRSDFDHTPAENFRWFPPIGKSKDFRDVPVHIARAAKEAHSANSINALMASILMARTVVEATAKAKGITKGNLVFKIDSMADERIIRDDIRDAAHEIRHFGNDMAHGDIEELPDEDDVNDVLDLMDEILREVFQGPAVTARLQRRRSGD